MKQSSDGPTPAQSGGQHHEPYEQRQTCRLRYHDREAEARSRHGVQGNRIERIVRVELCRVDKIEEQAAAAEGERGHVERKERALRHNPIGRLGPEGQEGSIS